MGYGLTTYGATRALAYLIPNGTPFYVALFTTLPAIDGTGGVEIAGNGYARVACSSWQVPASPSPGTTATLQNGADVDFPAFSGAVDGIVGFGIFDAMSGGNLIFFDVIRDDNGNPITKNFSATDDASFLVGDLVVGFEPD